MCEFLSAEKRDFIPTMDISITGGFYPQCSISFANLRIMLDYSGQTKLSLSSNINYKSNWQNTALKAQRRNKWSVIYSSSSPPVLTLDT
jgi:hypothetical protein